MGMSGERDGEWDSGGVWGHAWVVADSETESCE